MKNEYYLIAYCSMETAYCCIKLNQDQLISSCETEINNLEGLASEVKNQMGGVPRDIPVASINMVPKTDGVDGMRLSPADEKKLMQLLLE